MLNTMRIVTVAALLGITAGCGATSPGGPTPAATVVPIPPPTRPGTFILTPSTNSVARGAELSVTWTVSSAGEGSDWIAFSKVNDPNTLHAWSAFTEGKTSGTFTLRAPGQAGLYEFRYLVDDSYSEAARSTVVTVF